VGEKQDAPRDPIRLLTDELTIEPVLDSKYYGKTIADSIRGTFPKFSIGVYGEWGTGKTTIMKLIEQEFSKEDDIVTVWFNAWRYEREEQFAVIALMKTIAFKMVTHKYYKRLGRTMLRGALRVGQVVGEKVLEDLFTSNAKDTLKKIPIKADLLAEVEKDTIYYDGLRKIEEEMKRIRNGNEHRRAVVFIDDLDRCSPTKALEVFESIKVFLDIEGFVFVIGLSHETIAKLITAEYEKSGIKGEEYIRKIIQIPIVVPEWDTSDLEILIDKLKSELDSRNAKFIDDNKKLIALAMKPNPRELKRFINNFIITHEIFSNISSVKTRELFAVQAIRTTWNYFYNDFESNKEFRNIVKQFLKSSETERNKELQRIRFTQTEKITDIEKKVLDISPDLWLFLKEADDAIFGIENWGTYRRATASTIKLRTEDVYIPPETFREHLLSSISKSLFTNRNFQKSMDIILRHAETIRDKPAIDVEK
jgi:KAP family P-loop domain